MIQSNSTRTTLSSRHVRAINSNQETMSPSSLVGVCETNTNDQFELSFRDNRDRNSQQETTSLPTRWNKTKKQNRDASRVVYKTFREDMSCPASARNIPTDNIRRAKASWQDDDIDITYHQINMPNQLRHFRALFLSGPFGSSSRQFRSTSAS